MTRRARALVVLLMLAANDARAQVQGHVSLMFDVLPDVSPADGSQRVSELRVRLFAERTDDVGDHVRVVVSGYVDGLAAGRGARGRGTTTDVIVRPADLYAELVFPRFDLRLGSTRLVWGRLDEVQPTDVVNPIDLTRFLLEGRAEARLSTGLVRGRLFLPGSTTVEAVVVPAFRTSRFDQLDEDTSPFNVPGIVDRHEPAFWPASVQGGARVTSSIGRVDWGVTAYRGRRSFPILTPALSATGGPVTIGGTFPRFTMIGGDFETVRGAWGIRGELAAFVEDELQSVRAGRGVPGRSGEAGIGVDRRAGDYRIAGNILWSWRAVDASDPIGAALVADPEVNDRGLSLVAAADRSFARETRTLRLFTVYDPEDRTAFVRVVGAVSLRENTWFEGSGGIFAGSSLDILGRLTHRDFLYARIKVFF